MSVLNLSSKISLLNLYFGKKLKRGEDFLKIYKSAGDPKNTKIPIGNTSIFLLKEENLNTYQNKNRNNIIKGRTKKNNNTLDKPTGTVAILIRIE